MNKYSGALLLVEVLAAAITVFYAGRSVVHWLRNRRLGK